MKKNIHLIGFIGLFIVSCGIIHYQNKSIETNNTARKIAYFITKKDIVSDSVFRGDKFQYDPNVLKRNQTKISTYVNSGYDKGHLIPSADRLGSKDDNESTFYMTNIVPQNPILNRTVWAQLEDYGRKQILRGKADTVFIKIALIGVDSFLKDKKTPIPHIFYKELVVNRDTLHFAFLNQTPKFKSFLKYRITRDSANKLNNEKK